jgi:hypothetical protein
MVWSMDAILATVKTAGDRFVKITRSSRIKISNGVF